MLIIIEGPDKSGKSTLAKELNNMGFRYKHFGFPGPDPAKEYAEFLLNLREPTVCDRFYVGERVYGPLLRGTTHLNDLKWTVLERICRLRGAVMIRMTTPLELCQERLSKSEQVENVTPQNNVDAWSKFQEVFTDSHVYPSFKYNAAELTDLTTVLRWIRILMDQRTHLARVARERCHGIGTIVGRKMVIVGEKLNGNEGWVQLPFAHGPSSEFLLACLKQAEVPEELVYVCNADQLDHAEAAFLLQGTNDMPWLALGEVASKKLMELGVEQHSIPHPAYWRRFHFNESDVYVEMIKQWKEACR